MPKSHIWGGILCYPSRVHEMILLAFSGLSSMPGIESVLYNEYASSCIIENIPGLWISVSFTHCFQRLIVLGAGNFLTKGYRPVQKWTPPHLWKVFLASWFSFIIYKNKEPE